MKTTFSRETAITRVRDYNQLGIATSLSYLPVRAKNAEETKEHIEEYLSLFNTIEKEKLNTDATIKLMQFGISVSDTLVSENVRRVLSSAKNHGVRVWIDQGLAQFTHEVVSIATTYEPNKVGICIQAYHHHSDDAILQATGYPIRLVKGFYNDYDIRPWSKVTENYARLMTVVKEKSTFPCFATHDLTLITHAKKLLSDSTGEIQFFAGVRDELASQLVKEGYAVRIYVPYGKVTRFIRCGLGEFDLPRAIQRILHFKTIR